MKMGGTISNPTADHPIFESSTPTPKPPPPPQKRPRSVSNVSEEEEEEEKKHPPTSSSISTMPVIWHEPKKRLGNAWNNNRSRMPPKPVWPGLDHNGRPVVEETKDTDTAEAEGAGTSAGGGGGAQSSHPPANANANSTTATEPPTGVPPLLNHRSRKRKKQPPAVWKEILNEGHDTATTELPSDLQADLAEATEAQKRLKTMGEEAGGPLPSPFIAPVEIGAVTACAVDQVDHSPPPADVSSLVSRNNDLLSYLPAMAKGITQIQSMLGNIVSSGASSLVSKKHDEATVGAAVATITSAEKSNHQKMDAIISRMESAASRQEAEHFNLLNDKEQRIKELELSLKEQETRAQSEKEEYTKMIQVLEDEAAKRDDVITELQRAQEQERKESQNRVTEALRKIEELQEQNEKLIRRNSKLKAVKEEYDRQRAILRSRSTGLDPRQQTFLARKNTHNAMDIPVNDQGVRVMKSRKRASSLDGGHFGTTRHQSSRSKTSRTPLSDSSVDSFGTPKSHNSSGDEHHSDDSPFSSGSVSSTKAASRSKPKPTCIIPGNTIAQAKPKDEDRAPKGNRRFQVKANIRDLIPNYALDSLARGRSDSS